MPSTRSSARNDGDDNVDETQTVLTFEKKRKNGAKQLSAEKRQKTEEKQSEDEIKDDSEDDMAVDHDDSEVKSNGENLNDTPKRDVRQKDDEDPKEDTTKSTEANGDKTFEVRLTQEENESKAAKASTGDSPNIVEKGIIYFLTRGRVETEDPDSVTDLQRTYFVLRPLKKGAKLGEGPVPDENLCRLIALPKKTFPKSHSDRYMVFVEKSKTKMTELKETFFPGYEKETKTMGTRKTPPVSVIGEGVYAITVSGRNSYLAYILAIPSELGEVQKDLGIQDKGSFLISLKNPTAKGPQNTQLPEGPNFPKEIMDDFNGLRWIPVQKPAHMDFDNAQLLLIGEGQGDFANALEVDESVGGKSNPQKELEKLEDEEEVRIEHLHGDNTIFDDLRISQKEYALKSTW